jgi:uncharacterized protein YbbC (DUF1343 family)
MAKYSAFYLFVWMLMELSMGGRPAFSQATNEDTILLTGAEQPGEFLPLLKNKSVGVIANQTSTIGGRHLVDILLQQQVLVVRVFAPEHGFRGEAGPGDHISSGIDKATGLPLVSLYGTRRKPSPEDLKGIDVVVFDMQDVGARFYTYLSTLHLAMEACAEQGIPLIVLDRPNPNGFYTDGPVLDTSLKSFVGIAPIPVVHGLTLGEYARMANGEKWLKDGVQCELTVIPVKGYRHGMLYELPVRPSPNLPDMTSVYLYPSLCLFEGAAVSVGRGTLKPFHMFGFPGFENPDTSFTPVEIPGVISKPPYQDQLCGGIDLTGKVKEVIEGKQLRIDWLLLAYSRYPVKEKFFNDFFNKLAGDTELRKQVAQGKSEDEIRQSWQPALDNYRLMRKKYLLYSE